jgi:hypothetical protein
VLFIVYRRAGRKQVRLGHRAGLANASAPIVAMVVSDSACTL